MTIQETIDKMITIALEYDDEAIEKALTFHIGPDGAWVTKDHEIVNSYCQRIKHSTILLDNRII